jgi:tol-pal system protein YbgF
MQFPGLDKAFTKSRLVMSVLACLLVPVVALAQNQDTSALADAMERLRQDLADIQRFVYRGESPPAATSLTAQPSNIGNEERRAADTLVRVTAMEGELRSLTGAIEKIRHRMDIAGRRLDKLVQDVDFRLAAIERSLLDVMSMARKQAAITPPEAGAQAEAENTVLATSEILGTSNEPGVLGTIPVGKVPIQTIAVEPQEPKTILPEGTPKERYNYALDLLRGGLLRPQQLTQAEQAFREFLTLHSDHSLAQNARYWLGESYYVREDYNQAALVFVEGYQSSPYGGKAPDNLLKLGMSLSRLSRGEEACATFQELNEKFPEVLGSIKARAQKEWQKAGCE